MKKESEITNLFSMKWIKNIILTKNESFKIIILELKYFWVFYRSKHILTGTIKRLGKQSSYA